MKAKVTAHKGKQEITVNVEGVSPNSVRDQARTLFASHFRIPGDELMEKLDLFKVVQVDKFDEGDDKQAALDLHEKKPAGRKVTKEHAGDGAPAQT